MDSQQINKKVLCCACGNKMTSSKHINWVQLEQKAKWLFPTHGNILTGTEGLACAYICDQCYDAKISPVNAVEFQGDKVIYHKISEL